MIISIQAIKLPNFFAISIISIDAPLKIFDLPYNTPHYVGKMIGGNFIVLVESMVTVDSILRRPSKFHFLMSHNFMSQTNEELKFLGQKESIELYL